MKKILALGVGVIALGGCALPMPLQVASWALDGFSYLVTEKSVTDHGISLVAEKDCALFRGITEGAVCREWDDSETETLVADAVEKDPASTEPVRDGFTEHAVSNIPPLNTKIAETMPDVETLAKFDTASIYPASVNSTLERPLGTLFRPKTVSPKSLQVSALKVQSRMKSSLASKNSLTLAVTETIDMPVLPLRVPATVRMVANASREPTAGIYYVIGSFRNYGKAHALVGRYEQLVPEVLAAKLSGVPVFRVVVGPVSKGQERAVHGLVVGSGLHDSWALRVSPGDWLLAHRGIDRNRQIQSSSGEELARALR